MTITCGDCRQEASFDRWTTFTRQGDYKCPNCGVTIRRVLQPTKRHPNGFLEPGKVRVVRVS